MVVLQCQIVAKFTAMSTVEPPLSTPLRKDATGVAPGDPAEAGSAVVDPSPVARGPVSPGRPPATPPREIGGRDGPEPTRFGDWEKAGRCIDF